MKRKMNKRSRKALSPVVASIILIAVTVAVSIAVAAWMGALTFSFTATEQLQVTNLQFDSVTNHAHIYVTVNNTGTTSVTINEAYVNGVKINAVVENNTANALPLSWAANTGKMLDITYSWTLGSNYEIKMISSKGNAFLRSGVAPA
jgi:flagellin-like protein